MTLVMMALHFDKEVCNLNDLKAIYYATKFHIFLFRTLAMDVEYDAYTSSMDELQQLEDEYSCMLAWSTPTLVKVIIAKIAVKVHKDPKQGKHFIKYHEANSG